MRPSLVVVSQWPGVRGVGFEGELRRRSLPVEFSKNQRGMNLKVAVRLRGDLGLEW